MFESCKDLASLNEERIRAIRSGVPSVQVNKEYTRRKQELLSSQSESYKRVPFFPAPYIEALEVVAINASWEDEDPYTLYIDEGALYGEHFFRTADGVSQSE